MIEKSVENIVDLMIEEQLVIEEKRDDYVYTLICMTESIIILSTIILISIFLGNTLITIGFLSFFLVLKRRIGGYHAETFFGCYFSTILIYIGLVYICGSLSRYSILPYTFFQVL